MALDKPNEQDNTYKVGNLTFVTEKNLMEKVKPIKIDFLNMGFNITAGIDFGASGCGGCGSSSETSETCGT
ncbi:MAG: hypothetical protein JRJ44_07275 [Deltaproteobacteria bacterium]|nr:hypothetical protein [Deltaproteobacteria bacterium]